MKTLILVFHPALIDSTVNSRWVKELKKYPEKYEIHDVYYKYPDEVLDIKYELELIDKYEIIIFQFPLYWFNCPPLMKKWLDEILLSGWAYGKDSEYCLENKRVALAVTTGITQNEYRTTGKYHYTLQQFMAPFEMTFKYIKANYKSLFAFYGTEYEPTTSQIESKTKDYLSFIDNL